LVLRPRNQSIYPGGAARVRCAVQERVVVDAHQALAILKRGDDLQRDLRPAFSRVQCGGPSGRAGRADGSAQRLVIERLWESLVGPAAAAKEVLRRAREHRGKLFVRPACLQKGDTTAQSHGIGIAVEVQLVERLHVGSQILVRMLDCPDDLYSRE